MLATTSIISRPETSDPISRTVAFRGPMVNGGYNGRTVAIDPATGALIWRYGLTGQAGTAAGLLSTPDGLDLFGPGGPAPAHPATG